MYKYLEINDIFTNNPRVKGEITMVILEYFKLKVGPIKIVECSYGSA